MTEHENVDSNALSTLWVIFFLSLGLGVILGLVQVVQSNATEPDDALILGLSTWSNYLLVVAVVALVGALVLRGVRELLAARVSTFEQN